MRSGRARVVLATTAAVVVLLLMVLPAAVPLGGGILAHRICALGPAIATSEIWTPLMIVNAPQHGWAVGSVTGLGAASELLNASDGEVIVQMGSVSWTFYKPGSELVLGPGVDAPCRASVIAVPAAVVRTFVNCELQAPLNQSDQNLSTTTPAVGCPFLGSNTSASINDAYDSATCPTERGTDCWFIMNGPGERMSGNSYGEASLPLLLPLTAADSMTWVGYTLPAQMSVNYWMAAGGCWHYQALGGAPAAVGWYSWGAFVNTTDPNTCGSTFG